jgi:hypothetical protein
LVPTKGTLLPQTSHREKDNIEPEKSTKSDYYTSSLKNKPMIHLDRTGFLVVAAVFLEKQNEC